MEMEECVPSSWEVKRQRRYGYTEEEEEKEEEERECDVPSVWQVLYERLCQKQACVCLSCYKLTACEGGSWEQSKLRDRFWKPGDGGMGYVSNIYGIAFLILEV